MAWIPLSLRPDQLRTALEQSLNQTGSTLTSDEYYNQQEFGLLTDQALAERLEQLLPQAAPAPTEVPPLRTFKEGQAFEVRSLRYLKNSAESAEDRHWAGALHDTLLVELWLQHVVETGETYYPPLADDLYQSYQINEDGHHS